MSVFAAWVVLGIYLHMQWSYAMPKAPDPSSGRIHPLVVNHGWRIFVTAGESRFFDVATYHLGIVAFAAFGLAVWLRQKYLLPRLR